MRLKEIKEDMIIHCKTQEEADMLCEALGAEDKWKAYWKYAEDETCYHIHSNDICCYGTISSFTRKITEFSDLIIPDQELSAEEALLAYDQMCKENYCCNDCPIYGILGHECAHKMDGHITEIVDAIKKWKADREKNDSEVEKKEPKIETVDICQIIEILPDGSRKCVHEEDMNSQTIAEREDILKRYCMEHDGEFIAVRESVSRAKAVKR